MVFESVVVDVLNRFLGDYVVNLDSSQLSLGIWGGEESPQPLGVAGVGPAATWSARDARLVPVGTGRRAAVQGA